MSKTSGRLIQVSQSVTNGQPIRQLETGEFGMALDTNNEKLWIGSNSGNIQVVTERNVAELAVPDHSITRQELATDINDILDGVSSGTIIPLVTTTAKGLMSPADKIKLNGIEDGATKTDVINNLTSLSTTSALSAYQGRALKQLIDNIVAGGGVIDTLTSTDTSKALSANQGRILKGLIDAKPSSTTATSSTNGLMTASDKAKLDGIASGANKTNVVNNLSSDSTTDALSARQGKELKILIDNTIANVIVVRDNLTSTETTNALSANQGRVLKGLIDSKAPNTVASQSVNGLMSASDKAKLDNIPTGGGTSTQVLDVLTSSSTTSALSANQGRILNNNTNNHINNTTVHITSAERTAWNAKASTAVATTSANGLMSSADKIKLNSIATGANSVTVVDNLTSTSSTSALSANQGRVLKALIDSVSSSSGSIANVYQSYVVTGSSGTAFGSGANATGSYSFATGSSSKATGYCSYAEGWGTTSSENYSHSEGAYSIASGEASHAEGYETEASGDQSHAEGSNTVASGECSHSEGNQTEATGSYSHAEGRYSVASGMYSHAEGYSTVASGNRSHSQGHGTEAKNYASHAMGVYSNMTLTNATGLSSTSDAFVIGNGDGDTSRSNAFRVRFNGSVYGRSAYNSSGADYAEYFEWLDGNSNNEDRVGYFIALDGEKIRKANSTDEYILGVTSANPSVIGDSASEGWNEQYVKDEFGRIQYHYIDVGYEDLDKNGEKIKVIEKEYRPIYNPNYDPSKPYVPREDRQEWDAVGMMGKLLVRDDGTCEVNGYCSPNDDGIATRSDEGYRVMKRVSDNIIQVLVK